MLLLKYFTGLGLLINSAGIMLSVTVYVIQYCFIDIHLNTVNSEENKESRVINVYKENLLLVAMFFLKFLLSRCRHFARPQLGPDTTAGIRRASQLIFYKLSVIGQ